MAETAFTYVVKATSVPPAGSRCNAAGYCIRLSAGFDRLLIAQALTENLTMVTHDDVVNRYGAASLMT